MAASPGGRLATADFTAMQHPAMSFEIRVGDVVRLRKPHPCGGYEWSVFRLGADIGMQCNTCGRRVLLTRRQFERRVKTLVRRGDPASGPAPTLQSNSPVS